MGAEHCLDNPEVDAVRISTTSKLEAGRRTLEV